MDKLQAHQLGQLHRAFSVFIFNSKGELLLQQRALNKYHSGGKWTNTCCSHPRVGESTEDAANRRLEEEMGIRCAIEYVFDFTYFEVLEGGLTEHEYDHVYFGFSDIAPTPSADEVMDFKYTDMATLADDMKMHPDEYTAWLKICFGRVLESYHQYFKL